MSADVRYVKTDLGLYWVVTDDGTWLGDVYHDTEAREWYAYSSGVDPLGNNFLGIARTRREATDLILAAS